MSGVLGADSSVWQWLAGFVFICLVFLVLRLLRGKPLLDEMFRDDEPPLTAPLPRRVVPSIAEVRERIETDAAIAGIEATFAADGVPGELCGGRLEQDREGLG